MNISVIGTGYVGLVTGVSLAEIGHHVTCIDIDKQKVSIMNQGISPIYEPNLEKLMKKKSSIRNTVFYNLTHGRICFIRSYLYRSRNTATS